MWLSVKALSSIFSTEKKRRGGGETVDHYREQSMKYPGHYFPV